MKKQMYRVFSSLIVQVSMKSSPIVYNFRGNNKTCIFRRKQQILPVERERESRRRRRTKGGVSMVNAACNNNDSNTSNNKFNSSNITAFQQQLHRISCGTHHENAALSHFFVASLSQPSHTQSLSQSQAAFKKSGLGMWSHFQPQ